MRDVNPVIVLVALVLLLVLALEVGLLISWARDTGMRAQLQTHSSQIGEAMLQRKMLLVEVNKLHALIQANREAIENDGNMGEPRMQ